MRSKPLVLCILDGFGERESREANAVALANAPNLARMLAECPHTILEASGVAVGLPAGQMGNSEVGHLNFGAGRVAQMDLSRIDVAVADKSIGNNRIIQQLVRASEGVRVGRVGDDPEDPLQKPMARVHLMGLVSDGGIHSSLTHLLTLVDVFAFFGIPVVVHAFLDGRDTPPRSAQRYLQRLDDHLVGKGVIGTMSGRFYAMDRDKHWDRVKLAFEVIVKSATDDMPTSPHWLTALENSYKAGVTDEFVVPVRLGDYAGVAGHPMAEFGTGKPPNWEWQSEECALMFNFRPDRMRELCAMLTRKNLPKEVEDALVAVHPIRAFGPSTIAALTEYDPKLEMAVAFPKDAIDASFGEVIAKAGLKQFRCAETEKYAHVTYFFNGGRETAFEGEERKLVPSPRDVATYDLKPEMSAAAVCREVVTAIDSGAFDFILVNFANPDMVGHTGVLDAAMKAVESVDDALGAIRAAVTKAGGALIVTADHGNCETMRDESGGPHTAHTTNPVPLYLVSDAHANVKLRAGGKLADVAPTMLALLGIAQPEQMTGESLLDKP